MSMMDMLKEYINHADKQDVPALTHGTNNTAQT